MRRRTLLATLGALVLVGCGSGPVAPAATVADWNDARIRWYGIEDGSIRARETGRPVLLVVYTSWCPHCHEYSRQFHDPEVVALTEGYVMVRVDRDAQPQVSEAYAIDGPYVPRTLVLTSEGQVRAEIAGGEAPYRYFLDTRRPGPLVAVMRAGLRAE